MDRPTISVLTPTFGRSTIIDAIESVFPQLLPGDEMIIIGDGEVPIARDVVVRLNRHGKLRYMETPTHTGDFGCTPWDYALARIQTDYVMFLGDDNKLTVRALAIVREGVQMAPKVPHLFAMMHTGRMLIDSRACGQCDNQQLVIPMGVHELPKMADHTPEQRLYSDWVFVDKVINQFGTVMYHPDVIVVLEKQSFGAML